MRRNKYLKFIGKGIPKDKKIMHYFPYAYCVAKPALYCGAFVIPPQQNRLIKESYDPSLTVHNESVKDINVGDWVSIAYHTDNRGYGENFVIPLQPFAIREQK